MSRGDLDYQTDMIIHQAAQELREDVQFIQYIRRDGNMCAEFRRWSEERVFYLNKESVIIRLENLKKNNSPHEVTDYVLSAWPPE